MVQTVEYNSTLEIAPDEHKKSRITKKGQGNGKQGKNHTGRNSQKPKGKSSIPTGPISLKVRFGPRSLTDVIPLIGKGTDKQCTTGKERKESPKVVRNIDDQLEEELNLDDLCVSLSDICQPEKDSSLDPAAKSLDCHHESPSQEGLAIDNNCSDPGTSPDSEVINLVPGTPINARDPEDSHDLILSKLSASPGDIPSLSMHEKSKKKDRIPKVASSGVQDLLSPESMSNTEKFGQLMQRDKAWGESFHSDTSAMTTAGNGPGNMSSAEIFSAELPSCSNLGVSRASSNFGSGLEGNICSSLDTESPESELCAKVAFSPAGRNVPKGESCNIFGKGRSQVPKSSQRRGMASKKKGNKEKQYSKHEVRHESGLVKSLGVVNCHSRPENNTQSGYEDVGSGNKTLNGAIPDLDILRAEASEHHLKPRNAWVQCDDCQKWRRIAAALADQIEETNCKWTCKDNLDRSFGDCSIGQEKSNSEINAELEISDASGEEGAFDTRLNSNRSGQKPLVTHQSSWTLIKKNLFLHRSRKNQSIDEIMVCHCKPASDGRMGCGDGCLNRMLNIECVRRTCPCGEFCSNQQFQKRNYTGLKWFKCGKKGYGLQLLQDVSEGQFLIEYVGEVLDLHAYEARQKEYALKGHKHFYFMTLNGSEVIDACAKGNLGRFINHSCDPNCCTEKWMVNGEVCIGLFALRDIKKGEEVTFDYNYVRVFGAAAKRCICGSPQCRGYIGGDLLNAEVIVQDDSDDDYPAPVVQCEDGNMDDELNNIRSSKSSFSVGEIRTQGVTPINKNKLDEPFTRKLETSSQTHIAGTMDQENVNTDNSVAVVTLKMSEESKSFPNKSTSSALKKVETSAVIEGLESLSSPSDQPVGASLPWEDISNETMSDVKKGSLDADKVNNDSFSSAPEIELTSPNTMLSKSLRKFKSGNGGGRDESSKSSRQFSSTKKGKTKHNAMNFTSPPNMDSKLQFPQDKFKKPSYGSSNDRSEAVEDKLNELLDKDGGISKSKDASRCYLKLLLLTAASGDSCNGEAIQSNRDLSMILDALLKTKSRTVLADIINKNGLQMLHNTLKRYRREFNKIPILRKLLKVLEYLAVREILSHELINGGPSRPGVESFTGSILRLTEHTDKQVHQIARNFRDRWIRRPLRKRSCIDGDDIRMDLRPSSHYNRCSEIQNQWREGSAQPSQTTEGSLQSVVASTTADAAMLGGSSASCFVGAASVARKRKRKSRWDEEAEPNLDLRSETNVADDRRQDIDDDDVPPGFSVPSKASRITCDASSTAAGSVQEHSSSRQPHPVAMGNFQQRFISRSPVSYGIPLSMVQQFGSPQKERLDAWAVAPGIPFHPFPPLPPYPRDRRDSVSSAANAGVFSDYSSPSHSAQNLPSISGASATQEEANTKLDSQRVRDSHDLGRKFFKQQKLNHSTFLPWHRGKSRWGCLGNNSNNTVYSIGVASRENELRSSHSWEDVNPKMENLGHTFQQNLPQ